MTETVVKKNGDILANPALEEAFAKVMIERLVCN